MGYYDYPHTRNYDADLGWLIEHVKGLASLEYVDTVIKDYAKNRIQFIHIENDVDHLVMVDKTYEDVQDAYKDGVLLFMVYNGGYYHLHNVGEGLKPDFTFIELDLETTKASKNQLVLHKTECQYTLTHSLVEMNMGDYATTEYVDGAVANRVINLNSIVNVWAGTEEEYNAIEPKDPTTLYVITDVL